MSGASLNIEWSLLHNEADTVTLASQSSVANFSDLSALYFNDHAEGLAETSVRVCLKKLTWSNKHVSDNVYNM